MTKIKICGIKKLDDALYAHKAGADALGFIIEAPIATPRKISVREARGIIEKIPPYAISVGVIMPSTMREVTRVLLHTALTTLQIHGDTPASMIQDIKEAERTKVIRAYSMDEDLDLSTAIEQIGKYIDNGADGILLDSKGKKGGGGTGKIHDWGRSKEVKDSFNEPFILAGGLNPENVGDAIRLVEPYAVDVASGVESAPGIKNYEKIKKFIENVRNC